MSTPWRHIGGGTSVALLITNLGSRWRWMVIFKSRLLYNPPPRKNPGTQWIGGWVGTRAGRTFWRTEKSLASTKIQTPDHPVHSIVTISTTLPWHLLQKKFKKQTQELCWICLPQFTMQQSTDIQIVIQCCCCCCCTPWRQMGEQR